MSLVGPKSVGMALNFDLLLSLIVITLMCGHKCLFRISDRYLPLLWK